MVHTILDVSLSPMSHVLLSSLCQAYRSRPASRSEASALFGLDPSYLAQLALKDATKAVEGRPDWAKAYSRQVQPQSLAVCRDLFRGGKGAG